MLRHPKIYFVLGFLCHLTAFNYSYFASSPNSFFSISAISFCFYMLSFYYYATTKRMKAFVIFVGMLYLSNLIDELLFDPTKFDLNEYFGAAVAVIISILEYNGVDKLMKNRIRSWLKMVHLVEK